MWATILSIVLSLLNWFLDWYGASQSTKQKFLDLVSAVKNDGLISVQAHDEFQKQREDLGKNQNL